MWLFSLCSFARFVSNDPPSLLSLEIHFLHEIDSVQGRHDIQRNDSHCDDIQPTDIQYNDTEHNSWKVTLHYVIHYFNAECHKVGIVPNVVLLNVVAPLIQIWLFFFKVISVWLSWFVITCLNKRPWAQCYKTFYVRNLQICWIS